MSEWRKITEVTLPQAPCWLLTDGGAVELDKNGKAFEHFVTAADREKGCVTPYSHWMPAKIPKAPCWLLRRISELCNDGCTIGYSAAYEQGVRDVLKQVTTFSSWHSMDTAFVEYIQGLTTDE